MLKGFCTHQIFFCFAYVTGDELFEILVPNEQNEKTSVLLLIGFITKNLPCKTELSQYRGETNQLLFSDYGK